MNEPFSEELLSAYLDGELPHDERARVEEWLAASESHRRLFDDLLAIRRELQALPRESLDAAFSDRVLAAIRQRQDGGKIAAVPPPSKADAAIVADGHRPMPKDVTRALGMPAWRWFAAGVAATLLAVLVGVNAAPETMARIGMLPQPAVPQPVVVPQPQGPKQRSAEVSLPQQAAAPQLAAPGEAMPGEILSNSGGFTDGDQGEKSRAMRRQKDVPGENRNREHLATSPAKGVEQEPQARKFLAEAGDKQSAQFSADAEGSEIAVAKSTANLAGGAPPAAPGAAAADAKYAMTAEKKKADENQRAALKNAGAEKDAEARLELSQALSNDAAEVSEFAVTSQQAKRALILALDHRVTLATDLVKQNAEGLEAEQAKKADRALQGGGAGQGGGVPPDVQVAAVEITGPEADVTQLLRALGVRASRQLPAAAPSVDGRGPGTESLRGENDQGEGEPKSASAAASFATRGNAFPTKPGAGKPGEAAPLADGNEKSGGAPGNGGRDGAAGKSAKREAAGMQAFGAAGADKSQQRQLRVRLVVEPAAAAPTQK